MDGTLLNVQFQFRIYDDAPAEYRARWDQLRTLCKMQSRDYEKQRITQVWLSKCK